MADEDPEKAPIAMELANFVNLLNGVMEKVVDKGLAFGSFKRLLDRRVLNIKDEGYSDLADSIADDLILLEQDLGELQRLRSGGVSSFISSKIESILAAREVKRRDVEQELHRIQAQSDQVRRVLAARQKDKADLTQSVEEQVLEVARMRKALKDAEDRQGLLEAELVNATETCSKLTDEIKAFDDRAAALDHKIIHLLSFNDASKALLEEELKQEYEDELSTLEERIRHRQIS